MASLDRQKKDIKPQQVVAQASVKRTAQLQEIYHGRILPKMELLYHSLKQFCEQQNQSDIPIKGSYFIEGFGRLENLLQTDYQIEADSLIELNEINCNFVCAGQGELGVYIEGRKNIELFFEIFKVNGLNYSFNEVKDESGSMIGAKIALQRLVPVSFNFKVDVPNVAIQLQISNFESLGQSQTQFSPESITDDFIIKMLEYIKRRNKGFFNLDLSEIERRRIRAKVMYEQQQRAAELEAADKRGREKEPNKKGFFNRLIGR